MPLGSAAAAVRAQKLPSPSSYVDLFARPDTAPGAGLGTVPDGPDWVSVSGAWQVLGGRAHTTTSRDLSPIACIDTGLRFARLQAGISPAGGDCLYFRVVDAANWWRLRYRRSTSQTTTTENRYEGLTGGSYGWNGTQGDSHSHNYGYWDTNKDSTLYHAGESLFSNHSNDSGHSHSLSNVNDTGENRTVVTGTTTDYDVYLDLSVNGVVSVMRAADVGSTTLLEVDAGSAIACFLDGSTEPAFPALDDDTHARATMHGIGRGPSEESGSALDAFEIISVRRAA